MTIKSVYRQLISLAMKQYGEKIVMAFCFALATQKFGIPRQILTRFIKIVHNLCDLSISALLMDELCEAFGITCVYKFISNVTFVSFKYHESAKKSFPSFGNFLGEFKDAMFETYETFLRANKSDREFLFVKNQQLNFIINYSDANKLLETLDFNYVFSKLRLLSFSHVISDIMACISRYPENSTLLFLKELLELSRSAITIDPNQFPVQVMCRIPSQLSSLDINNNIIYERSQLKMYLKTFFEIAKKECRGLIPAKHCLLIPESLGAETHKVQKIYKDKDLNIIFHEKPKLLLTTWSVERQQLSIYFDEANVRTLLVKNLKNVHYIKPDKLLVETNVSQSLLSLSNADSLIEVSRDIRIISKIPGPYYVAVDTNNKSVLLLEYETFNICWTYSCHTCISDIVLSKNGRIALCILGYWYHQSVDHNLLGENKQQILTLDLKEQAELPSLQNPHIIHFNNVTAISEDGQLFATLFRTYIRVWSLLTGKIILDIDTPEGNIVDLHISSKTKTIITLMSTSIINTYDLDSCTLSKTLENMNYSSAVYDTDQVNLSISENESIACLSLINGGSNACILIWDLVSGEQITTFISDFCDTKFYVSPSGGFIVSNFPSGIVKFSVKNSKR